ncbi:MAG: RluA family pseudouridine synthase [Clostridia bacterium]|nr:RluA family pseudouridine synthase [Clostridia bacterium]
MQELILDATPNDKGVRIDKFISENADDVSRSFASKLCEDGQVIISGRAVGKNYKLKGDEEIVIDMPEPEEIEIIPEDIPLNIVYEDSDVIVINKPQGMVVHPAPGNYTGTLVNALMFHCKGELSGINGVIRPGIVHRIDKDTSGLLIVAKNNDAHLKLSAQLKDRKALRKYYALVNGNIKEDSVTIDKPIGRSKADRKKMAVVPGGRDAITHVRVIKRYGQYTLVECVLETGRTHQIRVHMASLGHSIVGDKTYGIKKERFNLDGQLLHAMTVGFTHPRTGKLMKFSSELPDYFVDVLNKLTEH